jgi:hypothetical protein
MTIVLLMIVLRVLLRQVKLHANLPLKEATMLGQQLSSRNRQKEFPMWKENLYLAMSLGNYVLNFFDGISTKAVSEIEVVQ